mgnify:CR=1 FL=1
MKEINWGFIKYEDIEIELAPLESAILKVFNITKEELYSKSRNRENVSGRKIMMYFMRQNEHTYQLIADRFNMNHASAIYHIKSHEDLLVNKAYSRKVNKVIKLLKHGN